MKQSLVFIVFCLIFIVKKGECIQCYKCESISGSDLECEIGSKSVPFANPCYTGSGLYTKANRCVKIVGQSVYDHQRIVIRDCTDRTLDKDSLISFDRRLIDGRAFTCKSNLCNNAPALLNHNINHNINLIKLISLITFTSLIVHKWASV